MYSPRKKISFPNLALLPKENSMKTVTYSIPNISCMHCVHTIQTEVSDLPGVKSVDANAQSKQATVIFDAPATEEAIVSLLKEINYPPVQNN
jgi:copper chaperone